MVRIYGAMTAERKSRVWDLWRKGTPMSSIARDVAKPPATVFHIFCTSEASCLGLGRAVPNAYPQKSESRSLGDWPVVRVVELLVAS